MPESSPWYSLYKFAPPHFPFCGTLTDHWVVDPVDTYSSVLYIFVAIYMAWRAKESPKIIKRIAWIPLFLTIGSILFHASFTYTFLVADFLGIFFLNFYGIHLNFLRLGKVDASKVLKMSLAATFIYGILMAVLYKAKIHSGILMIPILFVYMQSEWRCSRGEEGVNYKPYFAAIILAGLGYTAMLVEGPPLRLGCLPGPWQGKLQLHTIWHLMSALSITNVFEFYNQKAFHKKFS